jgi:CRISPR-associated protein Cas2
MSRQFYLAAYDVSCPRRLHAALQLIKGHATGGQKSAYECWLSAAERAELLHNISLVLDMAADRFLLLGLDPRSPPHTLGIAASPADPGFFYIH